MIDVALPRRDSKVAPGHRGIAVSGDPHLPVEEAARRRDFTINAMAVSLPAHVFTDPYGGLDDLAAGDEGPLRGAIDRMDLQRALAGLAPGFRMVLVLHDVEGYTHDEIATLLEIDEGTSKSQLSRARAAMRRALGTSTSPGNSHVR